MKNIRLWALPPAATLTGPQPRPPPPPRQDITQTAPPSGCSARFWHFRYHCPPAGLSMEDRMDFANDDERLIAEQAVREKGFEQMRKTLGLVLGTQAPPKGTFLIARPQDIGMSLHLPRACPAAGIAEGRRVDKADHGKQAAPIWTRTADRLAYLPQGRDARADQCAFTGFPAIWWGCAGMQ
jgi:hypothetical protein